MRRVLATTPAELEALRPLWEHLEPRGTIFQSYAWNRTAAEAFAGRARPYVLALEDDGGAVILPLALTGRNTVEFLGDMLFDYRDVLAAGDPALIEAGLRELGEAGYSLAASPVRQDATLATLDVPTMHSWVGAPYLSAADTTPQAFLAQHFKARKQMRRLVRVGAQFHRYGGWHTGLLRWVYERKAEQFRGSRLDIFSDSARRECMVEIAGRCGVRCEVFTIEIGGRVAAALVTYRDPGVRRLYTIWNDPAYEQYSPGIVMLLHACHQSLVEGLDVDFLTGEQPHKTRFATGRVQLYQASASAEELAGAGARTLAA